MRRILFAYPEVSPLFLNGGIGTFVFEAATLLARSGDWEVDVLTDVTYPRARGELFGEAVTRFRELGVRLIDLDRDERDADVWPSGPVVRAERYHRHVARLHRERRYDVIEFPDWKAPGFFAIRSRRTTNAFSDTRLVVHCHSSTADVALWSGGAFRNRAAYDCNYMERYARRYADVVLSPSTWLLDSVRNTRDDVPGLFLRNGYPISAATAPPRKQRDESALTVACISRFEPRKGQPVLAEAIRRLLGIRSEQMRFVFCGRGGVETSTAREVRRILKGVEGWEIAPSRERGELLDWIATSVDVCVVPSRTDNYPNVVLEAARAGCYVIASDAGGIPEMFADYGVVGALVPPEDPDALAEALGQASRTIRDTPDFRQRSMQAFEARRLEQERRTLETYARVASHDLEAAPAAAPEPRVSIIVTSSASELPDGDAIASARASDYGNFEVIAVQAANAGLAAASGELVVQLDSSSVILPTMLRACARALRERPSLAYVTTYSDRVRPDGERVSWRLSPHPKPLGAVAPFFLLENCFGDGPAMIRKTALDSCGGYSATVSGFENWDLCLRLHERGYEGDVIPEVHSILRVPADDASPSIAARLERRQSLLREHEALVRDHSVALGDVLSWESRGRQRRRPSWRAILTLPNLRLAIRDPMGLLRGLRGRLRS